MTKVIIAIIFILVIGFLVFKDREAEPFPTPTPTESGQKEEDAQMQSNKYTTYPEMIIDTNKNYEVTLKTNKGDIKINLFASETPKTVNNFVFLVKSGFYNGVKFHRIIKGFMIQGGDPTGTGAGGPGYQFEDEPVKRDYKRGIIAMANAGPNTNGSQFFIMHQDYNLPKNYTIFGEVGQGIEVVDAIANTPVTLSQGEQSKPAEEIKIIEASFSQK